MDARDVVQDDLETIILTILLLCSSNHTSRISPGGF